MCVYFDVHLPTCQPVCGAANAVPSTSLTTFAFTFTSRMGSLFLFSSSFVRRRRLIYDAQCECQRKRQHLGMHASSVRGCQMSTARSTAPAGHAPRQWEAEAVKAAVLPHLATILQQWGIRLTGKVSAKNWME